MLKGRGREGGNIGGLGERPGAANALSAKGLVKGAREGTRDKTSTRARALESGGWAMYPAGNKAGEWPMLDQLAPRKESAVSGYEVEN
jgi:hypothetical protein